MKFPDPESANEHGVVAMGGELSPESLRQAYSQGIFPWPHKGFPLLWFSPPERGVLFFKNFKVPKSTRKVIKNKIFEMTINQAFDEVIENCARVPRDGETGTWIVPELIDAYKQLFKMGLAISVEAWLDKKLVGGLYGVFLKNTFSGESMFFTESEASKVCLVYLVDLMKSKGLDWIDIQMVTPVLAQFGGEYVDRKKYLKMLEVAHAH